MLHHCSKPDLMEVPVPEAVEAMEVVEAVLEAEEEEEAALANLHLSEHEGTLVVRLLSPHLEQPV